MLIGVDIDDTLVDTKTLIEECWKDYIKRYPNPNYTSEVVPAEINTAWDNIYISDFWDLYREYLSFSSKSKEGASEALKVLRANGHQIHVITSRPAKRYQNLLIDTIRHFAKYDLEFDELITGVRYKGEYCLEHGVDLLIDDQIGHIEDARKHGVEAIQFTDDTNWKEITQKILKLNK